MMTRLSIWLAITAVVMAIPTIYFGFSPDSGHLIDIAENLSQGRGLTTYYLSADSGAVPSGDLLWPPLYPVVLAIFLKLGMGAGLACRLINILSFMAVTAFIFVVGEAYKPKLLSGLALGLWLLTAVNLLIANYAWSEPLFLALAALLFAFVFRMVKSGRFGFLNFLVLGIIAALATLCRFIGITLLVPIVYLGLRISAGSRFNIGRALAKIAAASTGFALLLLPYMLYRASRTEGTVLPPHPEASLSVVHNLVQLINAVVTDFAFVFVIVGILFFLLNGFKRGGLVSSLRGTFDTFTITISIWIVSYIGLMLIITSIIGIDEMNTRFVSPVYPFAVLILAYFMVNLLGEGLSVERITGRGLIILSVALVIGSLHLAKDEYKKLKEDSSRRSEDGYTHLMNWIESSTSPDDLFIGDWIWEVRFRTGRVVLESVHPPKPELTPSNVAAFLKRHGSRFATIYYVYEATPEQNAIDNVVREFGREGMKLKRVADFDYCRRPLTVFELTAGPGISHEDDDSG
jgi:uncharacterized membrane protein (UPF0136 family)